MIAAATAYRLVAHPYDVAPIDAMFPLSAFYLPRRGAIAWVFPFSPVILSDVLIYYQWEGSFLSFGRLIDYAPFALIGLLELWSKHRGFGARVAAVLATPLVFFVVSNFSMLNHCSMPKPHGIKIRTSGAQATTSSQAARTESVLLRESASLPAAISTISGTQWPLQ